MGDSETVAGGHLRVGGVSVSLTASGGGKPHGIGHDLGHAPGDTGPDARTRDPLLIPKEQQIEHPGRPFFDQQLDGGGIAQRCAGRERMLSVQVGRVSGA
jgi:hypothetical protein